MYIINLLKTKVAVEVYVLMQKIVHIGSIYRLYDNMYKVACISYLGCSNSAISSLYRLYDNMYKVACIQAI